MRRFNPYMPPNSTHRNQTYVDDARNWGPAPNATYDYPTSDWRSNAYNPQATRSAAQHHYHSQVPSNPYQAQDRYDRDLCQLNILRSTGAGLAAGAMAGYEGGKRYCPPGPTHPFCLTGSVAAGASVGTWGGAVQGFNSTACDNITRTRVDANGYGQTDYGAIR